MFSTALVRITFQTVPEFYHFIQIHCVAGARAWAEILNANLELIGSDLVTSLPITSGFVVAWSSCEPLSEEKALSLLQ